MSELRYIGYDETGTMRNRPATPSEIAAAHPKCETCGHGNAYWLTGHIKCKNPNSTSYDRAMMPSEYCPHHTALTGAPDET